MPWNHYSNQAPLSSTRDFCIHPIFLTCSARITSAICTQIFFKNGDFYDYRERCAFAGINVPIIAGIMPITTRKGMERISELALGSRIPAKLLRAISRTHDDEAVAKVGIHWATQQVFDLFDRGVRGIHFYTLNKSKPTLKIYDALGVSPEDKPR